MRYTVNVPITGYLCLEVEADSEELAITAAIDQADLKELVEWQAHKKIVTNRVFHGELNEANAVEVGEI